MKGGVVPDGQVDKRASAVVVRVSHHAELYPPMVSALVCEWGRARHRVEQKQRHEYSTASVVPDPALVNIKNTILPAASFYSSPNKVN
ncbi:hypothetical protein BDB00DRAFT_927520, partial [Zychaea mexicana]|uniref:uncharacterized protein n=1 Tax=Zychaea mexicana TaxID=64656 RepID=UPI0022FDF375